MIDRAAQLVSSTAAARPGRSTRFDRRLRRSRRGCLAMCGLSWPRISLGLSFSSRRGRGCGLLPPDVGPGGAGLRGWLRGWRRSRRRGDGTGALAPFRHRTGRGGRRRRRRRTASRLIVRYRRAFPRSRPRWDFRRSACARSRLRQGLIPTRARDLLHLGAAGGASSRHLVRHRSWSTRRGGFLRRASGNHGDGPGRGVRRGRCGHHLDGRAPGGLPPRAPQPQAKPDRVAWCPCALLLEHGGKPRVQSPHVGTVEPGDLPLRTPGADEAHAEVATRIATQLAPRLLQQVPRRGPLLRIDSAEDRQHGHALAARR